MRSILIDSYIRATVRVDLGISRQALRMMSDHIDRVLSQNAERFTDPEAFEKALGGFLEFTQRMIMNAEQRGSDTLDEADFFAARGRCGIIWWCE